MVSTVAAQQDGPGFKTWLTQDLSVGSLHVLPVSVCVSSLHQNMHVRHIRLGGPNVARHSVAVAQD